MGCPFVGATFFSSQNCGKVSRVVMMLLLLLFFSLLRVSGEVRYFSSAAVGVVSLKNPEIAYYRYSGQIYTFQLGIYYRLTPYLFGYAGMEYTRALPAPKLIHPEYYDFHKLDFLYQNVTSQLYCEPLALRRTKIALNMGTEMGQANFDKKFKSKFYDEVVESQAGYFVGRMTSGLMTDYFFNENIVTGIKIQLSPISLAYFSKNTVLNFWSSHSLVFHVRHNWKETAVEIFYENKLTTFPYRLVIHQFGVNILWKL